MRVCEGLCVVLRVWVVLWEVWDFALELWWWIQVASSRRNRGRIGKNGLACVGCSWVQADCWLLLAFKAGVLRRSRVFYDTGLINDTVLTFCPIFPAVGRVLVGFELFRRVVVAW